jgi:hypothetical protein
VFRDGVVLKTPRGTIRRFAGGIQSAYLVAPGARQQVNVRYEIGRIATGELVEISFDGAIVDGTGLPVPTRPIVLTKE